IDGSDFRLLTDDSDQHFAPAWSPDGTQIAFTTSHTALLQIDRIEADGSTTQAAMLIPDAAMPVWSPDGKTIAFVLAHGDSEQIYMADANGQNPVNVSTDSTHDFAPTWSPDGRYLAFIAVRDFDSAQGEIDLMTADGNDRHRLTTVDLPGGAPYFVYSMSWTR
ncbi:MAG TPA: hypothetical protein VMT34_18115, partial [Aggregatilineales bacterium]|nr:hypothetical protein [Aggregatilineales bacterium]